jgi:hypothetical protein
MALLLNGGGSTKQLKLTMNKLNQIMLDEIINANNRRFDNI